MPTTAAAYPFATSFTPSGSVTPTPYASQHSVTVKPGPLASLTVSPATATIAPGGSQGYTVSGFDAFGNPLGAITNAKFIIKPNGSCVASTCTTSVTFTSESSQPAEIGVTITPSPDNPSPIDVSLPGDVNWTGAAYNVEDAAAPAPPVDTEWVCSAASGIDCPAAQALDAPDVPTLTFVISQLNPGDEYTITFVAVAASDNYTTDEAATSRTFTTTDSGG